MYKASLRWLGALAVVASLAYLAVSVAGYVRSAGQWKVQPIDCEHAFALWRQGRALMIDARPRPIYRRGRIPGAISLPLLTVRQLSPEALRDRVRAERTKGILVVYCDDLPCGLAGAVAQTLAEMGVDSVYILRGGIEEWMGLGYPVTIGER